MRRALFTIVASIAVVAFVPASALAGGGPQREHHRHHHHHHRRNHRRARHHVRTHRFGHFTSGRGDENNQFSPAGTVTSFDPATGKLVITLNDGVTTETGFVTRDTEIKCEDMGDVGDDMRSDGGPGPSGGDGRGDRGDRGDGDRGRDGNGDRDDPGEEQNCSTSNLMTGTVVIGAELRISGAGAVWHEVEIEPSMA